MLEYRIKPIDTDVTNKLKSALEMYRQNASMAHCFSEIEDYYYELTSAFNDVVDARSKAIDSSFPKTEINQMLLFPDYKITIILDEGLENLLNDVNCILSEKRNWSK